LWILWKDVEFHGETEEKHAMGLLKEALCYGAALKTLDVSNCAGQIVVGVNCSIEWWGVIFQQEDRNEDRHPCRYECGLWNTAGKRYDTGKRECRGVMQALKKVCNSVYGVRFFVETDANAFVHRLNLPGNNLPGALVTRWIAQIQLFNFDVKHNPGRLNVGLNGRSWWLQWEGEPEPEEQDDVEETIEQSLRGIQVGWGPQRKWREQAYKLFVGLGLAEEYKERWNEGGAFLGNLKRPEEKPWKEMQRFCREATNYLGSDGALYRRRKSNELQANTSGSKEQDR